MTIRSSEDSSELISHPCMRRCWRSGKDPESSLHEWDWMQVTGAPLTIFIQSECNGCINHYCFSSLKYVGWVCARKNQQQQEGWVAPPMQHNPIFPQTGNIYTFLANSCHLSTAHDVKISTKKHDTKEQMARRCRIPIQWTGKVLI